MPTCDPGQGTEAGTFPLWRSDGTAEGTTLAQDILPGPAPSNPQQLTAGDGVLYFTANDGEHGRELWVLPLLLCSESRGRKLPKLV